MHVCWFTSHHAEAVDVSYRKWRLGRAWMNLRRVSNERGVILRGVIKTLWQDARAEQMMNLHQRDNDQNKRQENTTACLNVLKPGNHFESLHVRFPRLKVWNKIFTSFVLRNKTCTSLNIPQFNYEALLVANKYRVWRGHKMSSQLYLKENLYSNFAVRWFVVVTFQSCDCDVICL